MTKKRRPTRTPGTHATGRVTPKGVRPPGAASRTHRSGEGATPGHRPGGEPRGGGRLPGRPSGPPDAGRSGRRGNR